MTTAREPESPSRQIRLLVGFGGERSPVHVLRDAFRFSLALGAEAHVLRVVRPGAASELTPRRMVERARHESRRLIAAARHARVLCDRNLSERLPGPQVAARLGTFTEQVALRASEIGADVIAVSPNRKQLVATVQRLARATNRAIFVPRKGGSFATLLAATDLEEPNTPLLERAAQLGAHLDATLVALHGVPSGEASAPVLEQRLLQLEHATRRLGGHFESIVLRTGDPGQEIVRQARRRKADVVLVGTRLRAPGAAALVLENATCSVLVEPLTERVAVELPPAPAAGR
ncbi:MAG TPA: universal stress protein [Polyangiaceae bacterium]|nr:universal stress protein [Polyangiaceae bacterium]